VAKRDARLSNTFLAARPFRTHFPRICATTTFEEARYSERRKEEEGENPG
jgi:hypothetical protein